MKKRIPFHLPVRKEDYTQSLASVWILSTLMEYSKNIKQSIYQWSLD